MARQIVSGVTEKVLTHEVGAGAPCLKCGDKCPGLDLHFWRKICLNCKCSQENHDVNASISSKGIDNIGKLLMQDNEKITVRSEKKIESPIRSQEKESGRQIKTESSSAYKQTNKASPDESVVSNDSKPILNVKAEQESGTQNEKIPETPNFITAPVPDHPPQPSLEKLSSKNYSSVALPTSDPKTLRQDIEETARTSSEVIETSDDPTCPTFHNSTQTMNVRGEQGKEDTSPSSRHVRYDWKPPATDTKLAQRYMEALPEKKRPIAGTEGAKYRKKQLMRQLPTHDQVPSDCHDLAPKEINEMEVFVEQYREKSLGVAKLEESSTKKSCIECLAEIEIGDPTIWAERVGSDRHWHPGCFVCADCKELLVDLIYFYDQNSIYCGRHYCEIYKPRCSACDELIFATEYTQAEGSCWHLKHFCCWHCDEPLGGTNYVPHNNQPVCIPCFEKSFANACSTCKKVILPDTEWVTFENHHWHATSDCFRCTTCGESLAGKPCIPKDDTVFCSSKCKKEKLSPSTTD